MSRKSDIKKAVLRGVYEENAGMPRSSHGKRRINDQLVSKLPARLPWYRSKLVLVGLICIVALFGINFQLVSVRGMGPVAMQLDATRQPGHLADPLPALSAELEYLASIDTQTPAFESVPASGQRSLGEADYDGMLVHLGMSMADLFNLKVRTIVIDPGHGGIDPGATGHQGLKEKDVALDIARRLRKKILEAGDYRVLLTREDDRKVYLKERVAFAKANGADLFISIHINSLAEQSSSLNYVETYYFGPHTEQRSLALAKKENRDSEFTMGEFREVIARIGDTMKTEESRELAHSIHHRLFSDLRRHSGDLIDAGTKTGPFVVLLGVDVPSVLVEVSCISNKAEETRLSRPAYRDAIAGILKTGIIEYIEQRTDRRTVQRGKIRHASKQER